MLASLTGLLVLAPVLVAIAVWIKFDSPGPVFFRQVRVGRGGQPFRIFKFRTMRIDSEKDGKLTVGDDARITRSGRFLRRHKLDELPQLVDVLRGTMSLVGPRPEVPEYVACYPDEMRDLVLSVRPGITDNAALEMFDENAVLSQYEDPHQGYVDVVLPQKLALYRDYVLNQSMRGDVCIIWRTIRRVMERR